MNGRQIRVAELFDDLAGLCVARSGDKAKQKTNSADETDCEFDNLVQEIIRLMCVLESLKLHLPTFTLASVQSEVQSWLDQGESLFSRMLRECGLVPR